MTCVRSLSRVSRFRLTARWPAVAQLAENHHRSIPKRTTIAASHILWSRVCNHPTPQEQTGGDGEGEAVPVSEKFVVFGSEHSPYSNKVRSYCRFKKIPYQWKESFSARFRRLVHGTQVSEDTPSALEDELAAQVVARACEYYRASFIQKYFTQTKHFLVVTVHDLHTVFQSCAATDRADRSPARRLGDAGQHAHHGGR